MPIAKLKNKILLHLQYQKVNIPHKFKHFKKRIFHNYQQQDKIVEVNAVGVQALKFSCSSQRAINRANGMFKSEPGTINWILKNFRSNDVFYDIGSNIGVFTLLAATKIKKGRIYSFEPHSVTFNSLLKNILINGFSNRVIPSSIALHSELSFMDFNYLKLESAQTGSQFGSFTPLKNQYEGEIKELKNGVSIDYLYENKIIKPATYIKIDVDGNELLILQGMKKLLKSKDKPKMVLMEVRDSSRSEITKLFKENGYFIESEVSFPSQKDDCEYNIIFKQT